MELMETMRDKEYKSEKNGCQSLWIFLNHMSEPGLLCQILIAPPPRSHPTPPPQVFTDPAVSEEAMVTVVNDWVSFYINYYKKQMSGEQAEQDKALQEFRQELDTLSASFLDKYRDFLKSS